MWQTSVSTVSLQFQVLLLWKKSNSLNNLSELVYMYYLFVFIFFYFRETIEKEWFIKPEGFDSRWKYRKNIVFYWVTLECGGRWSQTFHGSKKRFASFKIFLVTPGHILYTVLLHVICLMFVEVNMNEEKQELWNWNFDSRLNNRLVLLLFKQLKFDKFLTRCFYWTFGYLCKKVMMQLL